MSKRDRDTTKTAKRGLALALSLTALSLLLVSAPVEASEPRAIASGGVGAGEVNAPVGVAVDQASGSLYVADRENFRILKFGRDGAFQLGFGAGVRDGVTVAPQTCGPQATPPSTRCFGLNPSGPNSNAPGVIVSPQSVTVDQADGGVYVSEASRRRVSKFSSQGEFLWTAGKGVNQGGGSPSTPGNLCTAQHLANGDTCGAGAAGGGPGAGEFAAPRALADGPGGKLWVGDDSRLHELNPDGTPVTQISLSGAGSTMSLALDSAGDFYVVSQNLRDDVRKLDSDTGALIGVLAAGKDPRTVATDGADNVYVGHCEEIPDPTKYNCPTKPYRFAVFNSAGEQISQFGAGQVIGLPNAELASNAVAIDDATGTLYSAGQDPVTRVSAVQAFAIPEPGPLVESQSAVDLLPDSVTLEAQLNPEGKPTTYHFEYGTTDSYDEETAPGMLPADFDAHEVSAALTGLTPDTTYHFQLVATSHCNPSEPAEVCTAEGSDTTLTTPTVVGIGAQWSSDVGASDAEVRGLLDPFGQAAAWWVEYGTGPCSAGGCEKSQEFGLPAVFGAQERNVSLRGLSPGTTYHYRFAARGEREGVTYFAHGPDRTLGTQRSGLGLQLADGRVWEMVSPVKKNGAVVGESALGEGAIQAAASGDGLAYLTRGAIDPDPAGDRPWEEGSALARRAADGRWSTLDLRLPSEKSRSLLIGQGREYKVFAPELDKGVVEPRDVGLIAPPGAERAPYFSATTNPPSYSKLLGSPAEVSACTLPYGHAPDQPEYAPVSAVRAVGASEQLRQVVLRSAVPLDCGAVDYSLYRWSQEGGLAPLSVLPAGEGGAVVRAELGSGSRSVRNAFSADGERAFWTRPDPGGLYLRDAMLGQSLKLDVVQPDGWGIGKSSPIFQGADREGDVAFFTDTHQLTADASQSNRDLYRCQVEVTAGQLSCALSNLTGPAIKVGKAAEVLPLAAGVSGQGDRIYFFARGVLDTVPNSHGDSAAAGQPNLYLWRAGAGVRFIATLAEGDRLNWGAASAEDLDASLQSANQSAVVSPNGRYLAFMSQRSLTGYDNRDAATGEAPQQVYDYDANSDELVCVSCKPSGARPRSLRPGLDLGRDFDPKELWRGKRVAALLPAARQLWLSGPMTYRTRVIHDNGRLFFNAADSLVGVDSNGDGDVYQYEPLGTGSCAAGSGGRGVARIEGGCVALISSGTSEGTSAFLDASVGGGDAFFVSPGRLSALDEDAVTDIYDARVGGIAAARTPVAECQGEACQPPPRQPEPATPASAAFAGPGNVAPRKTSAKRCKQAKAKAKGQKKTAKTRHGKRAKVKAKKQCHASKTRRAGR